MSLIIRRPNPPNSHNYDITGIKKSLPDLTADRTLKDCYIDSPTTTVHTVSYIFVFYVSYSYVSNVGTMYLQLNSHCTLKQSWESQLDDDDDDDTASLPDGPQS